MLLKRPILCYGILVSALARRGPAAPRIALSEVTCLADFQSASQECEFKNEYLKRPRVRTGGSGWTLKSCYQDPRRSFEPPIFIAIFPITPHHYSYHAHRPEYPAH